MLFSHRRIVVCTEQSFAIHIEEKAFWTRITPSWFGVKIYVSHEGDICISGNNVYDHNTWINEQSDLVKQCLINASSRCNFFFSPDEFVVKVKEMSSYMMRNFKGIQKEQMKLSESIINRTLAKHIQNNVVSARNKPYCSKMFYNNKFETPVEAHVKSTSLLEDIQEFIDSMQCDYEDIDLVLKEEGL
jgi:hypothetical protein